MWRHVTKISSLTRAEVHRIIDLALEMKQRPAEYLDVLRQQSLLMLFDKPSLRTRVSLEVGMTQLGGHALAYMLSDSPLGKKESYEDTGRVLSRMVDAVSMRVESRAQVRGVANASRIPVVNALDDFAHPMQILADLLTICEHKCGGDSSLMAGVSVAYIGDCRNNVTYDLMRAGALMGFEVRVAGPKELAIEPSVINECRVLGKVPCVVHQPLDAVDGVDIVYTDSWMSYGIQDSERERRLLMLRPFQVTAQVMLRAKLDASFMNCLPAMRGEEQTAEVLDGSQSIVFDQAENRLHVQKALLVTLLNRKLIAQRELIH
mmetsp:Transcript_2593/g.8713  ORF Transcript_2593/g.8713 Transcript_2593/m.8713 type:complete len:319 (-) Transcript_2593:572-1528(-)